MVTKIHGENPTEQIIINKILEREPINISVLVAGCSMVYDISKIQVWECILKTKEIVVKDKLVMSLEYYREYY